MTATQGKRLYNNRNHNEIKVLTYRKKERKKERKKKKQTDKNCTKSKQTDKQSSFVYPPVNKE